MAVQLSQKATATAKKGTAYLFRILCYIEQVHREIALIYTSINIVNTKAIYNCSAIKPSVNFLVRNALIFLKPKQLRRRLSSFHNVACARGIAPENARGAPSSARIAAF